MSIAESAGVAEEGPAPRPRFEVFGPAALAVVPPPPRWLVRGVWVENSHGPLAGAKKSFKSWNALALGIAVASGAPYLGKFDVERSGPVLYLNGEGGMAPFQRRYQRLCAAMGLEPTEVPIHAIFDTGEIGTSTFEGAVGAALAEIKPALVILDPLYVYHPAGIEAQNLYERGRMLGKLSRFVGHETALIVVDHYRKSGGGTLDLDEIGQSGVAQWADSWILQAHREPPDLEGGSTKLSVEYGSRQWGGKRQDVDWEFGAFDPVLMEPEGEITWSVEASAGIRGKKAAGKAFDDDVEAGIVEFLKGSAFLHTKEVAQSLIYKELRPIGATRTQIREGWNALVAVFAITAKKAPGIEGKTRDRWGPGDGKARRTPPSAAE